MMSLAVAGLSALYNEVQSMQLAFFLVAIVVWLIGLQRFPALRRILPV